jgi:hypothetical protein
MKKFVFLAGIAAAAYGAMKMFRGNKDENAFGMEPAYESQQPQAQPQPQI